MRVPKPTTAQLASLTVNDQAAAQMTALFTRGHPDVGFKRRVNFKLQYGAPCEFFCINPMLPTRPKEMTLNNIARIENFLVEADKGTLLAQERVYEKQLRLPYTTKVYSGGKSLHYIIRFDRILSLDDYTNIATIVKHVVRNADPSLKNPNRLSRTAGIVRHDTGRQQQLLGIGDRVPMAVLIEALKAADPARYNDAIAEIDLAKMRAATYVAEANSERFAARRRWTPEQHLDFSERKASQEENRHTAILNCGLRMLYDGHPGEEIELTLDQLCVRLGLDGARSANEVKGVMRWLEARVNPTL